MKKSQNVPVSLMKTVLAQHNRTDCDGWLVIKGAVSNAVHLQKKSVINTT
jgi:hypothetical protein